MTAVGTSYNEYPAISAHAAVYFSGRPTDTETFVVNGVTITYLVAGNADLDADITFLTAEINDSSDVLLDGLITAVADLANDVIFLFADAPGTAGDAFTLTEALTNATVSGANFTGGQALGIEGTHIFRHTITTAEALGGFIQFRTPMAAVVEVELTMEDAGLIVAAPDAKIAVSGGTVTLTEGTTPAWAAADVLIVTVKGIEKAR